MRVRPRVWACLVAMAFAGAALAAYKDLPRPAPQNPVVTPQTQRSARFLAFRSLTAQLDNQVVANLLTDSPLHAAGSPLMAVAGEITRCEWQTCVVPLTLRISAAEGPVTVAVAVANAKGELSDVRHAECGTGSCTVRLVLERGKNTISIGAIDGLSQTTAYTMLSLNATRSIAGTPGKTEWF